MKAKYSFYNLKLVYVLMIRDHWDKYRKAMGPLKAFLNFLFLEVPALLTERYCLKKYDKLIIGSDPLVSLILSIRLSLRGESSLVCDSLPNDTAYKTVAEQSQRLITPNNVKQIEKLIGEEIGACPSYDDLLRRLGEVLARINDKTPLAHYARNFSLINSESSVLLKKYYPNICWSKPDASQEKRKLYGLKPATIREKPNRWFNNYQCVFSFNSVIILTKLNANTSWQFFSSFVDFTLIKDNLGEDLIYASSDRIRDINSIVFAVERSE